MNVTQIYTIMNTVTNEILGDSVIVNEDLSNIVDVGTAILNNTDVDNYVKSLVNHIGKVIFVDRVYKGGVPSILMDSWEYGSVAEKITMELPEAKENESWELVDGNEYNTNIFYKPSISAKFFNKKVTFEIPMSFTQLQVKESFSNVNQLNSFLSMIYNGIEKSLTIKIEALSMRTINNFIGLTLYDEYTNTDYDQKSGVRAINLLYLYNNQFSKSITADEAMTDADFIRFATLIIGKTKNRLTKISKLFNIGGTEKFTPNEDLKVVALTDFVQASNVYLQSDVYHNELTALPSVDEVPYWQGSGTSYDFDDISSINIVDSDGHTTSTNGILAVMFDRYALGVANLDRRVTTNYNAKGEFYNNYYKFDAGYFNDENENFIVFFVA